jgi:hypothetical protein
LVYAVNDACKCRFLVEEVLVGLCRRSKGIVAPAEADRDDGESQIMLFGEVEEDSGNKRDNAPNEVKATHG